MSRASRVVLGGVVLLFVAMAAISWRTNGWGWVTWGLCALVPLGIAGLLDVLTARVELRADSIVIVRNLRRREYSRSLFVKATWAKGVPVSLQTTSGEWVELPGVGTSSQGMVNTLRAWMRPAARARASDSRTP